MEGKKGAHGLSRCLAMLLTAAMLFGLLPATAFAVPGSGKAERLDSMSVTDVTDHLTDEQMLQMFQENMDPDVVKASEIPDAEEEVRVIVELETESLLQVREDASMTNMAMSDFLCTPEAEEQLQEIGRLQSAVMAEIAQAGISAEVTCTYSTIAGGFAAVVPYGDLAEIAEMNGVRRVTLCETYYPDVMGEATLGEALSGAEIAAYANDTEYQGEGMLVGVLDTGLDWNHEAFGCAPGVQKLTKDGVEKMARYQVTQDESGKYNVVAYSYAGLWYAQKNSKTELALLTVDDLYKSAKVPFGFDYADVDADVIPSSEAVEKYGNDHGTHVAGIAAGKAVDAEGNVTFAGQAPEAQLAIFKVFSDSSGGASTDTILAALNDAILLGVDVINMSLGSGGGFSREAEGSVTNQYYDAIKAAGILLNCSAGNSYSSSYSGVQGDFTAASDPDHGVISSSSSYGAALSVASVNANDTATFAVGSENVPYADVSGHNFMELLLNGQESATYGYVMIPGAGEASDYEGLDVTGKIAVVMRGGLSFNDKQLNAAAAGAVGCVIYNNRDGYLLNMSVDNYTIPTVSISQSNGVMMDGQETKTLTVSKEAQGCVAMSDFSSWGPLPSLELKPEITAPGGSIWSSLPFGQYGYMSGTSMASPYMAGVAAAAQQYVTSLYPGLSAAEKQQLVNRLLMSTADILYDADGVPYSPRKQGAGMVDLAGAVNTPAYLYVRGEEKTKIELGDDVQRTGVYDLGFQVQNLSSLPVTYDIGVMVQTETVSSDGSTIIQQGHVMNAEQEIRVRGGQLEGSTLRVPAGGEASVVIHMSLSEGDKSYMDASFPNGIYVEGFVELTNNDAPSLSIPFLGFYGDWTEAPIFEDADVYNGKDVKMYATAPSGVYGMMYTFTLGQYPFIVPEGYADPGISKDRIALDLGGCNGMSSMYYLQAGLLRGVKDASITITDRDTGELIEKMDSFNTRKAMYNSSLGKVRAGMLGNIWPALTSMGAGILNNTRLRYTATAYLDVDGVQQNKNNTYSFDFMADSEMPYIVNREDLAFYYGEDGRVYLDVTLADNFCLAGATLFEAVWEPNFSTGKLEMKPGNNYYDGIIPALREDGSDVGPYEEFTYTFDVTDFYKKLTDGCFYLVAYDYALNQCAYRVALQEIPVTEVTMDTTAVTLPIRGYVQLNATVAPDNATDQALTWTSSDTEVAVVRDGLVSAKGTGTAVITAASKAHPEVQAVCTVTVTAEMGPDVPMTDFRLNYTGVSLTVGATNERVQLYAYTPYTATNYELDWTTSDPNVVTVTPKTSEGTTVVLTGVGPGTATVTAKARLGGATQALQVTVAGMTAGSFNIQDDVLLSYSGSETEVTIPDGIREIAAGAFNNNDAILRVICPDSVQVIGDKAFYDCDNLTYVRLPETMESIGVSAFHYCEKLTSFGLEEKGVIPKGLQEVSEKAFYFCKALEGTLVFPDTVTTIGSNAFYGCRGLTSIEMPDSITMLAGDNNFNGCANVTEVTLSAGLTSLPRNCFFNCSSLLDLPDLKQITSLGSGCFEHMDRPTSITIPAQITSIGGLCFYSCDNLERIHFEGSPAIEGDSVLASNPKLTSVTGNLTVIGNKMFDNDTALENFIVPDYVTSIGNGAFNKCTNLKHVTFPSTYRAETLSMGTTPFSNCGAFEGIVIEEGASIRYMNGSDGAIYTSDGKKLVFLPSSFSETEYTIPEGVEVIGSTAFYGAKTLTSVKLPSTLQVIEPSAFQNCTGLTSIELPDGVTQVGENAFYGCENLTQLDLGESLTEIAPYAFAGLKKLTAIRLPASVQVVRARAFYNCNGAEIITIPEGVEQIEEYAFYGCKAVTAIELPMSLKEMGKNAFYSCEKAQSIHCGGLTELPAYAFYGCKTAKSLTMVDETHTIGERAFYNCYVLQVDRWPTALESIGHYAFNGCRAMQNLDLSGTRTREIGNNAFYQCYEARNLAFPETLETIGTSGFAYLNYNKNAYVTTVHIPARVTEIAKTAFSNANRLQAFTVDEANPVYTASDGILIIKETGELYIWPTANTTTEFTVPADMTEIPAKMFQSNSSLKKIYIHSGVTKVGDSAFSSSKVEEIVFEPSAGGLTIGNSAFNQCKLLSRVELPYGLASIGTNAFSGCVSLESLQLPDTVTSLGASCFNGCTALTEMTLPAGLEKLPNTIFGGCDHLTEVTLPAALKSLGFTATASPFQNCSSLQNVWVDSHSRSFKSVDGVLFDYNGATLRYYPQGRTEASYDIPEGTVRVGQRAFFGNRSLTRVSFPTTMSRIGTHAFYNCENLKDYYFNGMTAPLLESAATLTGATSNMALYANFVGMWANFVVDEAGSRMEFNDWGLNLYYPEGAEGYTAYVWDRYFNTEKGSVHVMDASYFTVTDLTATEGANRTAVLSWSPAAKAQAESITYQVERSVARHVVTEYQDTWLYEGFATLAEGLTECAYTDGAELPFGLTYAYRVSAYNAAGETGPSAVATLYIPADPTNADEAAALAVIEAIESLKPVSELTLENKERVLEVKALYDALTETQKALVSNYEVLEAALAQLDALYAQAVEELIAALPEPEAVTQADAEAIAAARAAYDALREAQKALVGTYAKPQACEAAYAEWIRRTTPYAIVIEKSVGGTVIASAEQAVMETAVSLTVEADRGYTLEELSVIDEAGEVVELQKTEEGYTFTMPESQVTVRAAFAKNELPFEDVDQEAWYYDAVWYVYQYELMNGVSLTQFQPQHNLTRGQLVTILHRMAGSPEPKDAAPFTDVAEDQYYAKAIDWAYNQNIAKGMTDTSFAPNADVTREQMVTFLYRYAEFSGVDVTCTGKPDFPDVDAVSSYAEEAMAWAVANEIIYGMDGRLNPKGTATRAQIAAIIMRYCEKF